MRQSSPSSCRHKDFKWISALLALGLLCITFTFFNLFYLTSKPVAVEVGALVAASLFSPNGIDDQTDIAPYRQRIEKGETIQPIPGLPVTLSGEDLKDKSPREIRLAIFRQIVEPIYEGQTGIHQFSGKELTREEYMSEYGLLAFINRDTHRLITRLFIISSVITVISFIPLIYFSHGWGRLVSPALTIFTASLPSLLLFSALWFLSVQPPPLAEDSGPISDRLGETLRNTLPFIASNFARIYISIGIICVIALLAAGIGKTISRHRENY